jgi:FAD/FMN-containing dehydrogenase
VTAASILGARLAEVVGRDHVLADGDLKRSYECDLTGRFSGRSLLVVRPADTGEVSAVLGVCAQAGVGVVPQGGNTGMVGGATPRDGEVVLSLRRLEAIEPLDRQGSQITVGAGVTLEQIQQRARAEGLEVAIDHGARGSATIGGMAATDAGGHLAARYGTMRSQVVGLEVALADGRVVSRVSGLVKDNAGFAWPGLVIGSEGTLGVITRVRLKLIPVRRRRATALLGVSGMEHALRVLEGVRTAAPSLEAADWFEAAGLRRVCARLRVEPPFAAEHPVYLVLECAADIDPTEELLAATDLVEDSALAVDEAGRKALWLYREALNETIRALGVPLKLDVALPVAALALFVTALRRLVEEAVPGAELMPFGHLADGNVHVNILGAERRSDELEERVLTLVAAHGGSVSAEHGIGQAKTRWLKLCRSESELALMRGLKDTFDPHGVLNPGKVLA